MNDEVMVKYDDDMMGGDYVPELRPSPLTYCYQVLSKLTKPDEGDWRELKQLILHLKGTRDYAQVIRPTGSMSTDRELGVKPVARQPGNLNPSDLGTKAHSTKRLHYLMSLLGLDESFEESQVHTGNIRRLKRLLQFILATFSPHGADGHDGYGDNGDLEVLRSAVSLPTSSRIGRRG